MAISTALGKLAKLLACDPVNSQDVGNLQAEYDATFREKPLNSVCAKKMIGLIRQHASCTASAEVFPVLLVILAAMTENQASFRVLLDQSLCDAIQDVFSRISNAKTIVETLRVDLLCQMCLWVGSLIHHSRSDQTLHTSFASGLVNGGFIGSVLHCVQDPAVDIEVRRECTSMLASAVHGGSAFGATMLANAKTTTHLAALATGMLSLPDYNVQAFLVDILQLLLNNKAARKSPAAADALRELESAVPVAILKHIQGLPAVTDLRIRAILNECNKASAAIQSFPIQRFCWQSATSEIDIASDQWADVTKFGVGLSVGTDAMNVYLPFASITNIAFIERARSVTVNLGPQCPLPSAQTLQSFGFNVEDPEHLLRLCFTDVQDLIAFRAAYVAAKAESLPSTTPAPDAAITRPDTGVPAVTPVTAPPSVRPPSLSDASEDAKPSVVPMVSAVKAAPRRASRVISGMIVADMVLPPELVECTDEGFGTMSPAPQATPAKPVPTLPRLAPAPLPAPFTPAPFTPKPNPSAASKPQAPLTQPNKPYDNDDEFALDLVDTQPIFPPPMSTSKAPAPASKPPAAPSKTPAPAPRVDTKAPSVAPSSAPKAQPVTATPKVSEKAPSAVMPAPKATPSVAPSVAPSWVRRLPVTPAMPVSVPAPAPPVVAPVAIPIVDDPVDAADAASPPPKKASPASKAAPRPSKRFVHTSEEEDEEEEEAEVVTNRPKARAKDVPPSDKKARKKAPAVEEETPVAASRARPNVAEGRGAKPSPPPQAKENKSKAPLAPKRRREESEVEEEEEEDVGRRGRAADNGRKKAHPSPAAAPARSSPVPSRPSKPIIVTPRVADRRERPSDVDTRRQEHSRPDAVHPRAGVNALLGLDSLGDGNDDLQLMSTLLAFQCLQQRKSADSLRATEDEITARLLSVGKDLTSTALEQLLAAEEEQQQRLETMKSGIEKQIRALERGIAEQEKFLATQKSGLKKAKAQVSEVDAALSACAEEWASARAALRRDMEAHSEEAVKKVKAAAAAAAPAPNKSRAAALATLQQMLAAGMA